MGSYIDPADWDLAVAAELGISIDPDIMTDVLRRFPPGYRETNSPQLAGIDAEFVETISNPDAEYESARLNQLGHSVLISSNEASERHYLFLVLQTGLDKGVLRLRRYGVSLAELTCLVHVFESVGFSIVGDLPLVFA